jgi:hypothetical protein
MKTSLFVSRVFSRFQFAAVLVVTASAAIAASTEASHNFVSFVGGGGFEMVDGAGVTARFFNRSDVASDFNGNTYRVDTGKHVIYKSTAEGVTTILAGQSGNAGSTDGAGSAARFNYPNAIAADAAGNVYVADTGNNMVRKISADGMVTTLAGSATGAGSVDGTGAAARFNRPYSIAVTPSGNIYVADTLNYTVRKLTASGVVTTLAGAAGKLGSDDGLGTSATFNTPCSIAIDVVGNVYVADNGNNCIRKITPVGLVETLAPAQSVRSQRSAPAGCMCCAGHSDQEDSHSCACQHSVVQAAGYQ